MMKPTSSARPGLDHIAYKAVVASTAILAACASTGPADPSGLAEWPRSTEDVRLDTATYRFSFTVHGARQLPVPGMSWLYTVPEVFEKEVVGLISIEETQELTLQTGERMLDGREPCRTDVADRLTSGDSELEIQCGDVRVKLELDDGKIVDGTGFAWVPTDQGLEHCPIRRGSQCDQRARAGRERRITEYSWRQGMLHLQRADGSGGTDD